MTNLTSGGFSRRGLLGAFAATLVVAAPTYSNAFALLKGAGDIRRIRMTSGRTGESVDTIYWIEGEYIPEVMKEINHFMRDWRSGDATMVGAEQKWKFMGTTMKVLIACIIPFGTFYIDSKFLKGIHVREN